MITNIQLLEYFEKLDIKNTKAREYKRRWRLKNRKKWLEYRRKYYHENKKLKKKTRVKKEID